MECCHGSNTDLIWMSLVIFLPSAVRAGAAVLPRGSEESMRWWSLFGTAADAGASACACSSTIHKRHRSTRTACTTADEPGTRPSLDTAAAGGTTAPQAGRRRQRRLGRPLSLDPRFNIDYYLGVDGISMPLILLTTVLSFLAMIASWNIDKIRARLLHPVPAAGNRHARHVPGARFLPVLHLLGSDAAADVLPHRRLGRAAARVRGHQVLPVHAARQRVHPDRAVGAFTSPTCAISSSPRAIKSEADKLEASDPSLTEAAKNRSVVNTFDLMVLQRVGKAACSTRTAAVTTDASTPRRGEAQSGQRQDRRRGRRPRRSRAQVGRSALEQAFFTAVVPVHDVPAPVRRLRHQGAGVPVPHLVARRPRRGADADQHDPGRRAAQDGRLRHHPHRLSRSVPWAAEHLAWWIALFGIINIVYGAFAAMAQTDFKKLVAYSSISHMGYVILGIAVWSAPDTARSTGRGA